MTDALHVLRTSHDRFVAVVGGAEDPTAPSYDDEWTIADVASHVGSQAEIFGAFLDAGLTGQPAPGGDAFPPIWDRWNAMPPADQIATSVSANEAFVTRIEGLTDEQRRAFAIDLFGMSADLEGLAGMRLGEHAIHTWDIAVALDPSAVVAPDAVEVVLGSVPVLAGRVMKPVDGGGVVQVVTTDPAGEFTLDLGAGALLEEAPAEGVTRLDLPAEAFLRLVFGRLDPDHTPTGLESPELATLRQAFPGF